MLTTSRRRALVVLVTIILVGAWSSVAVKATTLAIIRSGNQIIIAADSLMTLYGRRPQLTCKIRQHGDVVFATAGLITTSGGTIEFHSIIRNILRRQLPWDEQARQVEEWIREPLLRTLHRMEREWPHDFEAQLRQGFTLHVSLAGISNGVPLLEMIEYFVERVADGSLRLDVERLSCPGECADATEVFGIGETDEMMRLVTQLRRLAEDAAALARDLVRTEIMHNPGHVGPPVDVVRLSPTGIDWVTLKPACAD